MSNYYREKRRMYEWAEKQVNAVHNSKQEAELKYLCYQATKLFDIGENTVKKRFEQIVEIEYADKLKIDNGVIVHV